MYKDIFINSRICDLIILRTNVSVFLLIYSRKFLAKNFRNVFSKMGIYKTIVFYCSPRINFESARYDIGIRNEWSFDFTFHKYNDKKWFDEIDIKICIQQSHKYLSVKYTQELFRLGNQTANNHNDNIL